MADEVPALIGTAGLVQGECFLLADGIAVVVGRSRSCDISLRRTEGYLKAPPATRDNDHDFNTVSRRHLRIEVQAKAATIEDLSTNGTFCNGDQVKQNRSIDLSQGPCNLRLGTRESFDLVMLPKDDPRIVQLQPVQPGSGGPSSTE